MVGTIGPLVQGALPRWRWRLQITALFVSGFLAGAGIIFAAVFLLGFALQLHELPLALRRSIAGSGLIVLAAIDLWARHHGAYCPVGPRRQTPRILGRRHSMLLVAPIWGFDTGLAVTTFRVAAATWGAMLLTVLGLAGWQTGLAYGFGFTIPVTFLMWTHRSGRMSVGGEAGDPGLAELLDRSRTWQGASAALLTAGAAILTAELFM